jgi:DNA invertase Pin-like site-specific DNA recombinase
VGAADLWDIFDGRFSRSLAKQPHPSTNRSLAGRIDGHILGYARVSTSGQDLTGQRLRLDRAGAIRIFETSALEGLWTDRVCKELHAIVLMSLEEMINTSSAAGELVFHVFGAIASLRAAADHRVHQGWHCRRARRESDPDGSRSIRNKVKATLKLVAVGLSPTQAAKHLGLGRSTVFYREMGLNSAHRAA